MAAAGGPAAALAGAAGATGSLRGKGSRVSYRVVGVAADWVVADGRFTNLPAGALTQGLCGLLGRVGANLDRGEGTVLLSAPAAAALGLSAPADVSAAVESGSGWRVGEVSAWATVYRQRTREVAGVTVHVCVLPWVADMPAERWPWGGVTDAAAGTMALAELAWQLGEYDRLIGAPFRARPGVAGLAALRRLAVPSRAGKPPRFRSQAGPHRSVADLPLVWDREETAEETALGWRHEYDLNAAYLGAAGVVECLARDPLTHTGPAVFDRSRGGYWSLPVESVRELEDQRGARRPPLVSGLAGDAGEVWLSTPTVALLEDLGLGLEIRDSWTAEGRRFLRRWAEQLDAARVLTSREPQLQRAIKRTYAEAVGMLNSDSGTVYRPDWFHMVVAQCRANLIRAVDKIGAESGRWPLVVDTDCLTYASGDADWGVSAPASMVLGADLGTFHEKER